MAYWKPGKKRKNPLTTTGGFIPPSYPATTFATAASAYATASAGSSGMYLEAPIDKGLAIEPIVGIREFRVMMGSMGPILTSYNGFKWPPRKALRAVCATDVLADHDAPGLSCACGIYAWKPGTGQAPHYGSVLWGEVYMWGDVLICDWGYRAEFAYPKVLHITDPKTRIAQVVRDGLEEAYGVTVTLDSWNPQYEETTPVDPFP